MLTRTLVVSALVLATTSLSEGAPHHRHRHRHRGGYGHPGYPSFHLGYAPGYLPSFGIGYGYYPLSVGFSFIGGSKDPRGAVRFDVDPPSTEVYVDGYYAGIVDDFGKLRLDPGGHDITLYLDGHRVFQETVYASAGSDVKIHHEMEPLAPGEPVPPRPAAPTGPARSAPASPAPAPAPAPAAVTTPRASASTEYGELALRAQPSGGEVWVDGERWHFSGRAETLTLHLASGPHTLEIRKDGYEPFVTSVDVVPGETTALNVRLGASMP